MFILSHFHFLAAVLCYATVFDVVETCECRDGFLERMEFEVEQMNGL